MSWQHELKEAYRSPEALLNYLNLDSKAYSPSANKQFSLLVTQSFASRIEKGNPACPLLKQVLPSLDELGHQLGFSLDPLNESKQKPQPGLLHKYRSRVLFILSGGCAINCRYCFRRHYPYVEEVPNKARLIELCGYLGDHLEINEVILSGGDPLLVGNERLEFLIKELEKIPHLKTLRFHSRLPIVLPSRMDEGFLSLLTKTRFKTVMVLHSNHPQELNEEVQAACQRLNQAVNLLLNQSVLLKGVNDSAECLSQLSHKLFEFGVMPYYLHQLDKVRGAEPFYLSEERARSLYRELQTLLPGYLLPKWVKETPHEPHKTLLI